MKMFITMPGSGKDWNISYPVVTWLQTHVPEAKIIWLSLHSDNAIIDFPSIEDVTFFKLKFPKWT